MQESPGATSPTRGTTRILSASPGRFTGDTPIHSIERSLGARGIVSIGNDGALINFFGRAFGKLGLLRNLTARSPYVYLTPMMGATEGRLFPQCYWAETLPCCFDCWPSQYDRWVSLFRRQRTRMAFFSARQSAERMRTLVPGLYAIWLPEAVDPMLYSPVRPLAERSIDVLDSGRQLSVYHERITAHSATRGLTHRFELTRGQIVFASRGAFVQGPGATPGSRSAFRRP